MARTGRSRITGDELAEIVRAAAREVPGVHSVGPARAGAPPRQGVSVEVGRREAAVDLCVVTRYGRNIAEVAEAIRRNLAARVPPATGLRIVEVNVTVDNVVVPDDRADRADRAALER